MVTINLQFVMREHRFPRPDQLCELFSQRSRYFNKEILNIFLINYEVKVF
ncbi:hypothetical protein NPIRD3C_1071 [Nitrosopumilus piranensis]|uniref:Uncharacterized protein n=1 Tax=Nitrosopumilus piranensis TaxID=1582439 RepID=A0A0C5BR98_9ARCH|nr:hypothetical protein NPIRD3C_1071 [Nitrosopumilus piranensis]